MTDDDKALVDRLFAMADEYDSGHHESWPTIDALEIAAHRIEALSAENERLRTDAQRLTSEEPIANCEGCGAYLLANDDYVTDPDGVSGCWSAMTDAPSKCPRPCYSYRVKEKTND